MHRAGPSQEEGGGVNLGSGPGAAKTAGWVQGPRPVGGGEEGGRGGGLLEAEN